MASSMLFGCVMPARATNVTEETVIDSFPAKSCSFTISSANIESDFFVTQSDEKIDDILNPQLVIDDISMIKCSEEESGFAVSYKFVAIPIENKINDSEYLESIVLPQSAEEYNAIEETDHTGFLPKSRALVYAMAVTDNGEAFFAANIVHFNDAAFEDNSDEIDEDSVISSTSSSAATNNESDLNATAEATDELPIEATDQSSIKAPDQSPIEATDQSPIEATDEPSAESNTELSLVDTSEVNDAATAETSDETIPEATPDDTAEGTDEISVETNNASTAADIIESTQDAVKESADDSQLYCTTSETDYAIGFKGEKIAFNIPDQNVDYTVKVLASASENMKSAVCITQVVNTDSAPVSIESLTPGTYYLSANYYLDPDNPNKISASSPNRAKLIVGEVPDVAVTEAASSEEKGTISISGNANCSYALISAYGSTQEPEKVTAKDGDCFVIQKVPGHYVVSFPLVSTATSSMADELFAGSHWKEVIVSVKSTDITKISLGIQSTMYANGGTFECPQEYIGHFDVYIMPPEAEDTRVTFASSDSTIATIDENGYLRTYKKAGTAIITATSLACPEVSMSLNVTVNELNSKKDYYTAKTFKPSKNVISVDVGKTAEIAMIGDSIARNMGRVSFIGPVGCSVSDYGYFYFNSNGKTKDLILTGLFPGHYYMTALLTRKTSNDRLNQLEKIIEVNVNGYNLNSKTAYRNGKKLSGWINVEKVPLENSDNSYLITSSGRIENTESLTAYIDPLTKEAVRGGIYTIGKKRYLFSEDGWLMKSSKTGVSNNKTLYSDDMYCINTDGEFNTGWQTPLDSSGVSLNTEYYFDPITCKKTVNSWVPKGKSLTYVDSNGVLSVKTDGITTLPGSDNINKTYCFKNGAIQTGFVFVSSSNELYVSSSKASFAYYFDPQNGGAAATGFFAVKGKKYYADNLGHISLNRVFTYRNGETEELYYANKIGAIPENCFVSDLNGDRYYAGANGKLLKNTRKSINGKMCIFDENGVLNSYAEGQESEFYYEEGGKLVKAYFKSSNAKKSANGIAFYKDQECSSILKNSWLSDSSGNKKAYIKSSGKMLTGIAQVAGKTLYFEDSGLLASEEGIITANRKYYYHNSNGEIETTQGFNRTGIGFIYVKDKNGVLANGQVTISKRKYCFKDGILVYSTDSTYRTISFNGTVYVTNRGSAPSTIQQAQECYIPTGNVYIVGNMLVGKNGTPYSGMFIGSNTKYFFENGMMKKNTAVISSGKLYLFGNDGTAQSGWKKFSGKVIDLDNSGKYETVYDQNCYFYLDPKTNIACTGWKTMQAPSTNGRGTLCLDGQNNPISSNVKKKIYFCETNTENLPLGALVCNTDHPVKGVIYRFGPDGSPKTGSQGKVYTQEMSDSATLEYYLNPDGTLASGRTEVIVNGQKTYYYYSPKDHKLQRSVIRKTGGKWYYYGNNGQQSTSFFGQIKGGDLDIIAEYNRDGSIRRFLYEDSDAPQQIKNAFVRCNVGDYFVIGNNGMPVTGMIDIPVGIQGNFDGQKILIENDGFCDFNDIQMPNPWDDYKIPYYLKKYSGKTYVMHDGVVALATGKEIEISDYSLLSTADQNNLDNISSLLSRSGKSLTVWIQEDGTVKESSFIIDGRIMHTDKYGVVKENLSDFYKQNGSWFTSLANGDDNSGYCDIDLVDHATSEHVKGRIHKDASGKIKSFTLLSQDAAFKTYYDTGNTLTGIYRIDDHQYICLKKGKLTTGKQKLSWSKYPSTMYFAPDYAIGYID